MTGISDLGAPLGSLGNADSGPAFRGWDHFFGSFFLRAHQYGPARLLRAATSGDGINVDLHLGGGAAGFTGHLNRHRTLGIGHKAHASLPTLRRLGSEPSGLITSQDPSLFVGKENRNRISLKKHSGVGAMGDKATSQPRCPLRSWKVWAVLSAITGVGVLLKTGVPF